MTKRMALRAAVFLLVLAVAFTGCCHVLGYWDNLDSPAMFEQFYDLPENSVDAVWIGSSSVTEYIVPPVIYQQSGITLYDLALGSLPFMASRFLMEECEKTQDPVLYLVDLRQLANGLSSVMADRVIDNLRLSKTKLDAADYMYTKLDAYGLSQKRPLLEILLPYVRYHSRWNDLSKEDFQPAEETELVQGNLSFAAVTPFEEAEIKSRFFAEPQPILPEQEEILNEFLDYCDGLRKTVVFTCTPSCVSENEFAKINYCKDLITRRGYKVWDLNECVDSIDLDYTADFKNESHVNIQGAEKVSCYVAQHLCEFYPFIDHRGDEKYQIWQNMYNKFYERKNEKELVAEKDFARYLSRVTALDPNQYTIFIAVKDTQGDMLTPAMIDQLKALGFEKADMLLEQAYHGFLGLLAGEKRYESISDNEKRLHYETVLEGQTIHMDSQTAHNGNLASICLGTNEYAKNTRGFNIVVIDRKDGEIVDSVAFDTNAEGIPCHR